MVEAEAESTEAEEAEEAESEPVAEPEHEPTPEPPPVEEKALKALGKVVETYANGLRRVMGDDFDALHECPTCVAIVPGFVLELPSPLDDFKPATDKTMCVSCNGHGQVISGAKNANALVMCMDCTGNGYVSITPPQSVQQWQPPNGAGQVPVGYLPSSADQMPTRDQWGRPLGHPQFGMDPASVGL